MRPRRLREGAPGAIDIGRDRTGQAGDDRAANGGGDGAHRFEVPIGRHRETGLDDVHAKSIELLGEPQLLAGGHAEAGSLLAVAQRRVEHQDARSGRHKTVTQRQVSG